MPVLGLGLERKDISINVDEGVLSLAATRPADPALVRGLRTVGCCQSVSATSITCCCWKCSESAEDYKLYIALPGA